MRSLTGLNRHHDIPMEKSRLIDYDGYEQMDPRIIPQIIVVGDFGVQSTNWSMNEKDR